MLKNKRKKGRPQASRIRGHPKEVCLKVKKLGERTKKRSSELFGDEFKIKIEIKVKRIKIIRNFWEMI